MHQPVLLQDSTCINQSCYKIHFSLLGFDQAMIAVKKKASSRSQILNFLCTPDMLNPAEFSGVARWFITLKTSCAKVQLPCAAKVLAHVARLDCATMHPDHFKLIQPFIERIILALWSRVHKSQSKEQFISNNAKMICLCVPE